MRRTLFAQGIGRGLYEAHYTVDVYRTLCRRGLTRADVVRLARRDTPTMKIVWMD